MFTATVPGPYGLVTGLVTDVSCTGAIVEITSFGVTYEFNPTFGIFFPKS